jgi:hypothetical protein
MGESMAEGNKKAYPAKKIDVVKDIYGNMESHHESERDEGPEGGPESVKKDMTGPIILSPSTYVEEDPEFDEEKRRPPEVQKKKYPPSAIPKDEFAVYR